MHICIYICIYIYARIYAYMPGVLDEGYTIFLRIPNQYRFRLAVEPTVKRIVKNQARQPSCINKYRAQY